MSEYIYDVLNKTSKLDWSFPFQRVDSFPLDRTSLFSSLSDAQAYALGLDKKGNARDSRKLAGASYVGQTLSVYDKENNKINVYVIETDRSLKEVGSAANIEELERILADLQKEIGKAATDTEKATGLYALLDLKANKDDVFTKEQTLQEIVKGVSSSQHLKRKIVVSIDSIDLDAPDADLYIYMVPNASGNYDEYMVVNGELEKVGNWNVDLSDYAKTEDVVTLLNAKVDKDANARLMTLAEGEKLSTIQEGAEKNFISSVTEEFEVLKGLLSVKSIGQEKVNGLAEALNKKVDAVAGSRLITEEEANKLNSLKDLIKSVDTERFTVNNDGKLLLNEIKTKDISGLESLLNNKVDKIEGSRLITNEEAIKLSEVEKNFINSVDETEFQVTEDRKLLLKSIEIEKINGLQDILNGKATVKSVSDLEILLNNKVSESNERLDALENRLTWKML